MLAHLVMGSLLKKSTERKLLEHLGPLELQIMQAVWESSSPCTVNDVLGRLNKAKGRDLVYNTVMSTMGRLYDKGYLDRRRDGKPYVYTGTGPDEFLRARIAEFLRTAYDEHGQLALAGFRDGLDEEAKDDLRRLLAEDD